MYPRTELLHPSAPPLAAIHLSQISATVQFGEMFYQYQQHMKTNPQISHFQNGLNPIRRTAPTVGEKHAYPLFLSKMLALYTNKTEKQATSLPILFSEVTNLLKVLASYSLKLETTAEQRDEYYQNAKQLMDYLVETFFRYEIFRFQAPCTDFCAICLRTNHFEDIVAIEQQVRSPVRRYNSKKFYEQFLTCLFCGDIKKISPWLTEQRDFIGQIRAQPNIDVLAKGIVSKYVTETEHRFKQWATCLLRFPESYRVFVPLVHHFIKISKAEEVFSCLGGYDIDSFEVWDILKGALSFLYEEKTALEFLPPANKAQQILRTENEISEFYKLLEAGKNSEVIDDGFSYPALHWLTIHFLQMSGKRCIETCEVFSQLAAHSLIQPDKHDCKCLMIICSDNKQMFSQLVTKFMPQWNVPITNEIIDVYLKELKQNQNPFFAEEFLFGGARNTGLEIDAMNWAIFLSICSSRQYLIGIERLLNRFIQEKLVFHNELLIEAFFISCISVKNYQLAERFLLEYMVGVCKKRIHKQAERYFLMSELISGQLEQGKERLQSHHEAIHILHCRKKDHEKDCERRLMMLLKISEFDVLDLTGCESLLRKSLPPEIIDELVKLGVTLIPDETDETDEQS